MIRNAGVVSGAAALGPFGSAATPSAVDGPTAAAADLTDNLYTRIGVRPMINARGTYTIISGSQSLPEVKQAMFEASRFYVQLDELMAAVGAKIASHMGAPSAIVTCGCEAAIALATAACICGTDPELSQSYPYIKKRGQVIIPKYSRNPYDFGIRMSGPEIVEVSTDDELRAKIGGQTAMIYVLSGPRAFEEPLSIKTICAIAKERGVPVFVDAAAEEPLVPNIHLAAGATFVAYSGGKCMRGPQTAGVLLGPKDLCEAAFWNAAPHHNWGRALKVGKEEAMGMLAAVRAWYKRDHDAEQRQWLEWIRFIAAAVQDIPSMTTEVTMAGADLSNRAPTLAIRWDAAKVGVTGTELVEMLDQGTPRIFVLGGEGRRPDKMASSIGIMPYMLQSGEYKTVAATVSKYLRNPGKHADPPVYSGATAKLAGAWDVRIQYRRGVGAQRFQLTQDGNAVSGTQQGEIFQTGIHGTVQGDHAVLTGTMAASGNDIHFVFSGTVRGDTFSGDVKLGEYGIATFQATRA